MAGAAADLGEALLVNPTDRQEVKIGMTASLAKYNLRNQREVSRFIARLIESEIGVR